MKSKECYLMKKEDGAERCIDVSDRIKHFKINGWPEEEIKKEINKYDCRGCLYSDGEWHL